MKKFLLISLLTVSSTIVCMQRVPGVGAALLRNRAFMARGMASIPQDAPQAETLLKKHLMLEELRNSMERHRALAQVNTPIDRPVPSLIMAYEFAKRNYEEYLRIKRKFDTLKEELENNKKNIQIPSPEKS